MKISTVKAWLKCVLLDNLHRRYRYVRHIYNIKVLGYAEYSEPVWDWFELSYAQYLTIPRSILQGMPTKWQKRFVKCLEELDNTIDWRPNEGRYWVQLKDSKGRYKQDPFMQYRHTKIEDIPYRPNINIVRSNGSLKRIVSLKRMHNQ